MRSRSTQYTQAPELVIFIDEIIRRLTLKRFNLLPQQLRQVVLIPRIRLRGGMNLLRLISTLSSKGFALQKLLALTFHPLWLKRPNVRPRITFGGRLQQPEILRRQQ
ncbi:MAG: hypothetical protein Udaeo2_20770 [Candidatus Udaeobacter sp.]|nr:MAG: hypothetical protein Udaeo2_20770 [Candidatus Udaeobacter sp.]